jgi:hypothetical protein
MSHIRIDKQKALKKWSPVLENMGVTGEDRLDWMSEYAEYHSINENAYSNATIAGMGSVQSPQPSYFAGYNQATVTSNSWDTTKGNFGSGDLGQNLLPVAMKIAAQTIGLDLVAVKPSPGPKLDLLYIDFQYDDVANPGTTGRPQIFKISNLSSSDSTVTMGLDSLKANIRGNLTRFGITETADGLRGGRLFVTIATGSSTLLYKYGSAAVTPAQAVSPNEPSSPYGGMAEFLGFSRIDGAPIVRAYRQANSERVTNPSYPYTFDSAQNTFSIATMSMVDFMNAFGTVSITIASSGIELISALEDHVPGFSTNWIGGPTYGFAGQYPMDRLTDDNTYAGVIGPKVSSKSIAVGTIEVSSALRRTEIEDIKANTGMDIVQKMESILVNELSQTISKQIVSKVFEMGDLNRKNAPLISTQFTPGVPGLTATTIFDLDTNYASFGVGGETTHAVQRKLITKMVHASNYIATEGRVGPAQFAVTNGGLAAALMDIAGYTINPTKSKINGSGQLYPVGQIGDIQIYVDPYMKYNDNRIVLGRKNNPDQPGIVFVPYLMAQSINLISEATFAPRLLLRSRYAVAEVGWYPQKQFMTISVVDKSNLLN